MIPGSMGTRSDLVRCEAALRSSSLEAGFACNPTEVISKLFATVRYSFGVKTESSLTSKISHKNKTFSVCRAERSLSSTASINRSPTNRTAPTLARDARRLVRRPPQQTTLRRSPVRLQRNPNHHASPTRPDRHRQRTTSGVGLQAMRDFDRLD